MNRNKIDYGIDLGTTNSAICRMERGVPVIRKIEVTDDTMPSCVFFNKKGNIIVGASAYQAMKSDKRRATRHWNPESSNAFVEFKRTMGTDHVYESSHMGRGFSSEELSAEVLKTLKSFITDEEVRAVVITVPAKFTVNQKTATMNAARLAGFRKVELLQEPIAASLAYGLQADQRDGRWMVFDFGGGTFDAALLRVENGIMQVVDTAGDNYLGGKNLDEALVEEVLLPALKEKFSLQGILNDPARRGVLKEALKTYAEEIKNQLSFKEKVDVLSNLGELGDDETGEEIELDLTVTQEEAFRAMIPVFQKAVDICKELLERNGMNGTALNSLILVGGPTHSPLIRQMLREQLTPKVDTSIDPMTAVAIGAALYASTIDNDADSADMPQETIRLNLGYEATSVEPQEWISVSLDREASGSDCPESVYVELVRGDESWSSGRVPIGAMGNVLECVLREGKANSFAVHVYDAEGRSLPCFPEEISIIQGSKVGAAPLPYNIGISVWDGKREKAVFHACKGLEKNNPLPAVGVSNGLHSTAQLRPGVGEDVLTIPVYQADFNAEGSLAILHEYVADVIISGDEVSEFIPNGSEVDVTLKVDSSEMMAMEIYFPQQDVTVKKVLDTSRRQSLEEAERRIPEFLKTAQESIKRLEKEGVRTNDLKQALERVKKEHRDSTEKKAVLEHVKEVMRNVEARDTETEWDRLVGGINKKLEELHKTQALVGDEESAASLANREREAKAAIASKQVDLAAKSLEDLEELLFHMNFVAIAMGFILRYNERFGKVAWKDAIRARQLLDQGLALIGGRPSREEISPIVHGLCDLLPEAELRTASVGLRL